jgi:hypothetical protein
MIAASNYKVSVWIDNVVAAVTGMIWITRSTLDEHESLATIP